MATSSLQSTHYPFLQGGGEMAELIGRHDWPKTGVGSIDVWPVSLRTALGLVLTSRFPMLLFWGEELITFYNDAFRPSLGGNGKHPSSLGQRGEESWAESWPVIGPMIRNIMAGGDAVWFEDQKLPIYREGRMDYAYWTYSFSPVRDDREMIGGVLVTCAETTKAVQSRQQLVEIKEQQELAIEAAELGIWDLDPATGNFTANDRLKAWFGLRPDEEIGLSLALDVIDRQDRERVTAAISQAMELRSGGSYEAEYTIVHPQTGKRRIVQAKGRATFNEAGVATRLNGTLLDVTEQTNSLQQLEESRQRLLSLFEQSPVAIAIIGKDKLTFQMANPFYGELVDRKPEEIVGKPLLEALPEIAGQGFDALLKTVIETGEPFIAAEAAVGMRRGQGLQTIYLDLAYQPMREPDNTISGVLVVATDVTQQVLSRKAIEESEARLRLLITEAPFATAFYLGEDLLIDTANEAMIKLWGKTPAVIGVPLVKALPELEGQPFVGLLHDVLRTGVAYHAKEERADLVVDGRLQRFWFNFSYKPLFDKEGRVYGVLNMAVDISEQLKARREAQEAESRLLQAIELAKLGTWHIDLLTGAVTYSERLQDWLGADQNTLLIEELPRMLKKDRSRVSKALKDAISSGGSGLFDEIYTVINRKTGEPRVIHANGKTVYGATGKALFLSGTAQDITIEQELQVALEEEVQLRTADLATANRNLAESNRQLLRSNEELGQYAYVASHDLQEPLRKIQLFSSMLKNNNEAPQSLHPLIAKIQDSTGRMSLLIRDLLDFSRLLKTDSLFRPVDLNEIMESVSNDYEILIAETGAVLEVEPLPVIEGIAFQMRQLFYNLIGNALKFVIPEAGPVIRISCKRQDESVDHTEAAGHQVSSWHHITITDNGIGFSQAYAEQIFEIFKRLHSRDQYSGTGIGLALCKKIVENHRGKIYANGKEGQGACFHVMFPVVQSSKTPGISD